MLVLVAADHGGYIVYDHPQEGGMVRQTLFAGSLEDCMGFMRRNIAHHIGPEEGPAPATADDFYKNYAQGAQK